MCFLTPPLIANLAPHRPQLQGFSIQGFTPVYSQFPGFVVLDYVGAKPRAVNIVVRAEVKKTLTQVTAILSVNFRTSLHCQSFTMTLYAAE